MTMHGEDTWGSNPAPRSQAIVTHSRGAGGCQGASPCTKTTRTTFWRYGSQMETGPALKQWPRPKAARRPAATSGRSSASEPTPSSTGAGAQPPGGPRSKRSSGLADREEPPGEPPSANHTARSARAGRAAFLQDLTYTSTNPATEATITTTNNAHTGNTATPPTTEPRTTRESCSNDHRAQRHHEQPQHHARGERPTSRKIPTKHDHRRTEHEHASPHARTRRRPRTRPAPSHTHTAQHASTERSEAHEHARTPTRAQTHDDTTSTHAPTRAHADDDNRLQREHATLPAQANAPKPAHARTHARTASHDQPANGLDLRSAALAGQANLRARTIPVDCRWRLRRRRPPPLAAAPLRCSDAARPCCNVLRAPVVLTPSLPPLPPRHVETRSNPRGEGGQKGVGTTVGVQRSPLPPSSPARGPMPPPRPNGPAAVKPHRPRASHIARPPR